jgi:hypothetical protein
MTGSGLAISQFTWYIGMLGPFVMGLNLGPVEDESSMTWMKVIMMTPVLVSIIHLLIFYIVYPSPTPKFLVS